jgi:DNA topoisomerase VI subunit B
MANDSARRIERTTFTTSRALDFLDRKNLEAQTGHPMDQWALVVWKELGDNALDVCEEAGIAPEVTFRIDTRRGSITVSDNGPGIPAATVTGILDFDTLTSSRAAYVIPTRGAQGNALKTLLAMPYVMGRETDGEPSAATIIDACGIRHSISIAVDAVQQKPVVTHETRPCDRKTGTSFTIPWPKSACSQLIVTKPRFVQIAHGFALLNPHASITMEWDGEPHHWPATDPQWVKWSPGNPTPPSWYDSASFERLVAATVHKDGTRTVRDFVAEFRGLSRSDKVAEVLRTTGLARTTIAELFRDGKPTNHIAMLLSVMQWSAGDVKPADLGIIGKEHFKNEFRGLGYGASFEYKRVLTNDQGGLPVVIEVAFGFGYGTGRHRTLFTGVNFSPAINNPFKHLGSDGESLERVLSGQRCDSRDPIIVAVHLTCPRITYLDRGKGGIALRGANTIVEPLGPDEDPDYYLSEVADPTDTSVAGSLTTAVKAVTKRWLKQKKAEERQHSARANRNAVMARAGRETQKAVAFDVMERAYLKASANDTLPANARQIMYAARNAIQERSGQALNSSYFTQTLLPNYIKEFEPSWADNVMFDDRGHFREPHTNREIGLGTAAVRAYLRNIGEPQMQETFKVSVKTTGPTNRFGGVLFVEKEGFDALFTQVKLAERYDLAFMSTKGISVVAARELADSMCAKFNIPLLLLTDFDKAGFTGAGTFQKDNRRFTRQNNIDVITLGLRLEDVRALGIEDRAEDTFDKGQPEAHRANLEANGATNDEINFLLNGIGDNATGKRVELNALTSDEMVEFVENKLRRHGVKKIVPQNEDLADAYQLYKRGVAIRETVRAEIAAFREVSVPADLEERLRALLKQNPAMPWDEAVAVVAGWRAP